MHSASDRHRADVAHCRAMLREGSRSFHAASLLLPHRVRDAVSAVYAFCRVADDLVDRQAATHATVEHLTARLDAIYRGRDLTDPVDRALSAVVDAHAIPQAVFGALLEGFAWEADGRRYETLDDVVGYSVRVAASVGVAVSCILGRRSADVLARATDLGIAMQLTNIARDVGEDARAGRLYLPRTWLRDAGLDPEAWLRRPMLQPEIAGAVRRLLEHAEAFYRRADVGIAALPAWSRPSIRAARTIYADIGRVIARAQYDSVRRRAFTSMGRKIVLATRAVLPRPDLAGGGALAEPPHPRAHFLVRAAALPNGAAAETVSHFATT